jgi:hypothetical protein
MQHVWSIGVTHFMDGCAALEAALSLFSAPPTFNNEQSNQFAHGSGDITGTVEENKADSSGLAMTTLLFFTCHVGG